MVEERIQRRLAAILAADVVGYSRLMGEDEAGTRARFNGHLHELIEPAIASHLGRIVKTTGDGLLVEFGSVVEAVQCAVDIQTGMTERNAEEPDDGRIESSSAQQAILPKASDNRRVFLSALQSFQ